MKRFEQIVEDSRQQMAQGVSRDEIIASLHARGASIIESIKVMRILYHINLRDAKIMVTAHPVWADLVHRWNPIHAALLEEFEKETHEGKGRSEEFMENQSVERWISFEAGSKQTLALTPLGGDLYRLEWTPLLGEQEVFLGDVIEAETLENGELAFRRLVTPSSWHHWQWILSKEVIESPAFEALQGTIKKLGGEWERYLGGVILLHLPPGVPLDPQEEVKKSSI